MSGLYDCEASMRRVRRAERDVSAQRIFIRMQADPHARARAEANLSKLEDALGIMMKTHTLIMDVVLQRVEDEVLDEM